MQFAVYEFANSFIVLHRELIRLQLLHVIALSGSHIQLIPTFLIKLLANFEALYGES